MARSNDYDRRHSANLDRYGKKIDALFGLLAREAARIGASTGLGEGSGGFSFDRFPLARKRAQELLSEIRMSMLETIESGIRNEWDLSESKNAAIVERLVAGSGIPEHVIRSMQPRNAEALEAFLGRSEHGLSLSDRVWNITSQAMAEAETAIGMSIGTGNDAQGLSRDVRNLLRSPGEMWRRYYVTRAKADGTKAKETEWRRKVAGKDGRVHFVREPLSHPGRGVYRSSYRNALRLAVTETNMAYHRADSLAWQQSPACIGIEVRLSNNHTCRGVKGVFFDICDELAGKYPKDFAFIGWHPFCRCVAIPITAGREDFVRYIKEKMAGRDVSQVEFPGTVRQMPENFTKWKEENKGRIEAMRRKGTLPWFINGSERRIADAHGEGRNPKNPIPEHARKRRKEIRKIARETLAGKKIPLPQIGATATISNKCIKEWLNQPFHDVDAKNESLLEIENIMANAEYKGFVADKHDPSMKAHIFEVAISHKKAWVVIREIYDEGYKIHSIMDSDKISKMIENKK